MSNKNMQKIPVSTIALAVGLSLVTVTSANADRRPVKNPNSSISVMDSTEAQWGRRSINDSVYQRYPVNAIYMERGRQRLPESFKLYRPTPVNFEQPNTSSQETPATIRVNGVEQKIPND